jgi:hypothetical protein
MDSSEKPGSNPLRAKHEVFARSLARGLSPTAAAREAGYPTATPSDIANARKRSHHPGIRARLAYLVRDEEAVLREQRAILMERLWLWHDRDIADYFEEAEEPLLHQGQAVLGEDGRPIMRRVQRLKPFAALSPEQRVCIESLTWTEKGRPVLKLYRADEANKELRRMQGLDKPARVAVWETDEEDKPVTNADRARALAAFLAMTQAEMAERSAGMMPGELPAGFGARPETGAAVSAGGPVIPGAGMGVSDGVAAPTGLMAKAGGRMSVVALGRAIAG